MQRLQNSVLFGLAFLLPGFVLGAEEPELIPAATTILDQVTISATRTERDTDEVPATVSVIEDEEIERQLAFDIKDLIRYEPGVSVSTSPARFGNSGFNIRGIDGNRVLIQIDGVRVPDSFSIGSFSNAGRDLVDLDSLKSVEILRGPASTLYGSDALGGVVSYFTKDPEDYLNETSGQPYFDVKTAFDTSDEEWKNGFTVAAGPGRVQGLLQYVRRDGHEQENQGDNNTRTRLRTTPNPQDTEGNNWLGKLVFAANADNSFKFTVDVLDDTVETDVLNAIGNMVTPTRTTTNLIGDDDNERQRFSLEHDYHDADARWVQNAHWLIYTQQGEVTQHTEENQFNSSMGGSQRLRVRDFLFEQETLGGELQLESNWISGAADHSVLYGFEVSTTETSQQRNGTEFNLTAGASSTTILPDVFPVRDFPESDTLLAGLFIQDEIAWDNGRFILTPALRYDYYQLEPDPDAIFIEDNPGITPVDITDSAFSPKLGAVYTFDSGLAVYGQYAEGFRAPPFNDANIGFTNLLFGYTAIPNADLVPETSQGVELGLRGSNARGRFNIAAFYNRYEDFIESLSLLACPGDPRCSTVVPLTFQSVNLDKVRIFGLEASGAWEFNDNFTLKGSLAYAEGDNLENDQPLNSIDPFKAVFGLQYQAPGKRYGGEFITTAVAAKSEGRVDETAGELIETSGFAIVDVLGWYQLSKRASFNIGVFNLLDKKYSYWSDVRGQINTMGGGVVPALTIDRFTQPGINASTSFRYQF
jgi:hemoglobin/transferrin/lactoferrin receptor protein